MPREVHLARTDSAYRLKSLTIRIVLAQILCEIKYPANVVVI